VKLTQLPIPTSSLNLRTATEDAEVNLLRQALNREHYLKAGRAVGHTLWQGVYETNSEDGSSKLVCVLCWGAAAKHLKDRENLIQWDKVTCANRLKLVVQLRRFLILDSTRRPNLASQCMGISLRSLQDEWEKAHGYRPLLAESFHDPKQHTGTLYKVTNWTPLGLTKGFARHRADFYQDLKSPKQLWVKPLQKSALGLLSSPSELPEVHQKAVASATSGARSALKCSELRTLRQAFEEIDDPRKVFGKRHPFTAMLTLISYGLICGAPDVKSIWRKCGALDENQRRSVGLTQRSKATGRLTMPGYDALNDLINKIDPNSMAKAINNWLIEHSDSLPKTLAIDGKDLGGKAKLGSIVTLCHSSSGIPLTMDTYSGGKNDSELPVTTKLLAKKELPLANAVVTNDALGTQKNGSPNRKKRRRLPLSAKRKPTKPL
jgi:hypothetical protein